MVELKRGLTESGRAFVMHSEHNESVPEFQHNGLQHKTS